MDQPAAPELARLSRRAARASVTAFVVVFGAILASGADLDELAGGGTPLSLVAAALEAALAVTVSLWLLDLFRRRFDHQGPLAVALSRAAFAAFVLCQLVLVGLVLASRFVTWAPELEYLAVSSVGVVASFGLAAAVLRIPGVARVL